MADKSEVQLNSKILMEGGGGDEENKEIVSALQKHVMFFDMDKDGIVYPWETFQGFRAIGSGLILSTFAGIFINLALSNKTRPGKFFSILFPIEIDNIQKAKHSSDSGVYDKEGRFVPSKFEELFKKYAITYKDSLTSDEIGQLLQADREPYDFYGWAASFAEWVLLYVLCKDKDGLLHKETVRAVYDGSLFEQMTNKKASSNKHT